jgi:epoxyqueuosine reductase
MVVMSGKPDTSWVAERAQELGFALCGVAKAEKFPELARTEQWLERRYAGEMKYLSDPRRTDPRAVMEGVRSVIVCALNYNTGWPRSIDALSDEADGESPGWISRYAWGGDYHDVVREKLEVLREALHQHFSEGFSSRVYVDTGPLSERILAMHAGLGWIGKNTLLLNQQAGSFFFLGVILTTLDLEPSLGPADAPPADLCGTCRRCIDACPTEALVEPYVMDARRCISYLTIELRDNIPVELREGMGRHVFGCDICQDVCPWNRRAPETCLPDFQPRLLPPAADDPIGGESLFKPSLRRLASMTESEFREVFRSSPVKRTKWRGLVRNACIALGNSGANLNRSAQRERQEILSLLQCLAASSEPLIAESAQWALSRIQRNASAPPVGLQRAPGV